MASDDTQLEALCEVPELGEAHLQNRTDSHSRWRLPVFLGALAAIACMSRIPSLGQGKPAHIAKTRDVSVLSGDTCAYGRMNCNETKCCGGPGLQCYQQNKFYSQCRQSCTKAPDPAHWDGNAWGCQELGTRSAGEPDVCSKQGEDCSGAQCCADAGLQCFQKNSSWSTCKAKCAAGGPDLSDVDGKPWTCKALGERSPEAQPWVNKQCSAEGDNCLSTKCCMNPGDRCYMQNEYWGVCKSSCDPKYESGWSCKPLGVSTPSTPADGGGVLSPWVTKQCSKPEEGCADSGCCLGMDYQCYKKDKYWAICKQSCQPGRNPFDKNETWSCEKIGPRSYGLAIKGSPSLYCFSVLQTQGYEADLMNAIHDKQAGIFACDSHTMLTADGQTKIGGELTTQFRGAAIIGSVDGTAGNTELFVNAWSKIVEIGQWSDYAFTAKVDPDAVFIPEKLRWHLGSHVGKNIYFVNCAAWNMMYGSLEVFSYAAIQAWARDGHTCNAPADFGEDKYMTQCMDHLKVTRVDDFGVVGDKLCGSFTDCTSLPAAAFHPFKDVYSWMDCWQTAMNVIGKR